MTCINCFKTDNLLFNVRHIFNESHNTLCVTCNKNILLNNKEMLCNGLNAYGYRYINGKFKLKFFGYQIDKQYFFEIDYNELYKHDLHHFMIFDIFDIFVQETDLKYAEKIFKNINNNITNSPEKYNLIEFFDQGLLIDLKL